MALTLEQIKKIYQNKSARELQLQKQKQYFEGLNPKILEAPPKEAPDNRIPVPIARRAVFQVKGYMAKPGSIVYAGKYYEEVLKELFDEEEEEIVTSELLEDVLKHGAAFELHYVENGKTEFAIMPQMQGIPVYDNSLKKKLIDFLYWFTDDDFIYIWDYDATSITHYKAPIKTTVFEIDETKGEKGKSLHGYKQVPVNVYTMARDGSNLFDHCRALIDQYDKILSEDNADELERFANAYLVLSAQLDPTVDEDTGESEIDRLKRTRVFQGLGADALKQIGYLYKDQNPAFMVAAADRFERLIYEMLMIFNPSDEKFAVSSGIAMAYKILAFEYLCTAIQTWFSKGLQNRIALISAIRKSTASESEVEGKNPADEVSIDFKRNLPFDLSAIADIALKLDGILSQETILKLFPSTVVPDVKKEMKKVNQENADKVKSFMEQGEQVDENGEPIAAPDKKPQEGQK